MEALFSTENLLEHYEDGHSQVYVCGDALWPRGTQELDQSKERVGQLWFQSQKAKAKNVEGSGSSTDQDSLDSSSG